MTFRPDFAYAAASLLCAMIGAFYDVKSRRVPNLLTVPAFVLGLTLHAGLDGWRGLGSAAAAGLIAGAVFLIFYLAGGMGAGDVKLIAAVAALAGMPRITSLLLLTALAGGILAVLLAVSRGRLKATLINVGALLVHHGTSGLRPHPDLNLLNSATLRLPYAVAIAGGSALTLALTVHGRALESLMAVAK
ncbi:MAG TPA: A24 family peptidase [Acidisarcina sp.]